ncbi:MAG TPA: cellulose binding domain-containing protein [Pseudonocardiaceae bacterium]|nr:cellulose binding domain-containing protein [Pseudonocardiaceae bacterium]
MKHTRIQAALWGAVVALLVVFMSVGSADVAAADTTPAWTGTFDNFHSSGWNSSWGLTSDTAQCAIAVGNYNCNWGYPNLQAVNDSTSPNGQALKVTYPADSGPPSCFLGTSGCKLGGGQFYQDLTTNGQTALHNSSTIDLKYYYNFPVGFDFGGKTAGKMPGLYGGVPGCESGGQHCQNGWSTRYMWRGGSKTAPDGELYFYGGSGDGYGDDLCLGKWTFPADGTWHSIEQLVNIGTGDVTIWSDGHNVCQTKQSFSSAVSGVFFSTFHGGHDLSWSPTKTTTSEFADFTLATNGPQGGGGGGTAPATPTTLKVTGSSESSIGLSWKETNNSDPAVSYKVYEGSNVVATTTSPSATVSGLAAGSSHTYTVTAVDASGNESPPSTPVTGKTTGTGGSASVTIKKTKSSGKTFTDTGTIVNNSGSAIDGWNVQLDLAATMKITKGGKVTVSSSGNHYTLTSTSADAKIAAGARVTFTFTGSFTKSYVAPTNVTFTATG